MEEIWKNVKGYEGFYRISNMGNVHSLITNKILKQHKTISGYYFVNIFKNKKGKGKFIHHMVAESFLNHTVNGFSFVIDHINNDKKDNSVNNLQIITNRQNSIKDKTPKSGHSCIYLNNKKWLVRLRHKGKKISLGTFSDINDAIKCRDAYLESF